MNWVRCDTYYFDLFIRNLERGIGNADMLTCVLNIRTITQFLILLSVLI